MEERGASAEMIYSDRAAVNDTEIANLSLTMFVSVWCLDSVEV